MLESGLRVSHRLAIRTIVLLPACTVQAGEDGELTRNWSFGQRNGPHAPIVPLSTAAFPETWPGPGGRLNSRYSPISVGACCRNWHVRCRMGAVECVRPAGEADHPGSPPTSSGRGNV